MELNKVTELIIGAAFEVSNIVGVGFLEKVYENALAVELRGRGLKVGQQAPMVIKYKQAIVGEYIADLLVEDQVLVELKIVDRLHPIHRAQCLNYLKATDLSLALLINFGKPRVQYERIINSPQ